ncbi:MAG: YbdD/YjiX family protein [Gammaproteobacteria bacterium]
MRATRLWAALRAYLRWLNGDSAYERWLAHLRAHHPDAALPSRAAFYRAEVERRWSGIRRCC